MDRLGVRIALIVAIGVMVGAIFSTWHEAQYGGPVARVPVGTDFATLQGVAVLMYEGDGEDIYTPDVLGAKLAETTGYDEITSQVYGHPPFFVLYFLPLAPLSFGLAYVVFAVAGAFVLGLAVARLGGLKPVPAVGIALLSVPGFATLQLGQMGLWVSALLLAVYLALRRGQPFLAGILLGLLAFKPLYAVGIGVWWLLSGRRYGKAILGAACSTAALVAAGFLVPGGWSGYLTVLDGEEFFNSVSKSGFSMLEMWSSLLPGSGIAFVLWAATVIGLVVVFRRMVRQAANQLEFSFAFAVVLGLLISPRIGWYDWVLLVVPAVLLWEAMPERRDQLVLAGAWLFPTAALSWPVARWIENVSGVFIQVAPMVLAGVSWWLFKDLVQHSEPSNGHDGAVASEASPRADQLRVD
jgi:hypothetical protein